jgi:hypothetical protein
MTLNPGTAGIAGLLRSPRVGWLLPRSGSHRSGRTTLGRDHDTLGFTAHHRNSSIPRTGVFDAE